MDIDKNLSDFNIGEFYMNIAILIHSAFFKTPLPLHISISLQYEIFVDSLFSFGNSYIYLKWGLSISSFLKKNKLVHCS